MGTVTVLKPAEAEDDIVWMSPADVCKMLPGMTEDILTGRRKRRLEPAFYKPTGASGNVVLYDRADVVAWVKKSLVVTHPQAVAS